MDQLDILENLVSFLISLSPLLGVTFSRQIKDIVFNGFSDLGLNPKEAEQRKNRIFERFEYFGLMIAYSVVALDFALCVVAYYHQNFWIGIVGGLIAFFVTILPAGYLLRTPVTEFLNSEHQKYFVGGPLVIFLFKVLLIWWSVGIDVTTCQTKSQIQGIKATAITPTGEFSFVTISATKVSQSECLIDYKVTLNNPSGNEVDAGILEVARGDQVVSRVAISADSKNANSVFEFSVHKANVERSSFLFSHQGDKYWFVLGDFVQ